MKIFSEIQMCKPLAEKSTTVFEIKWVNPLSKWIYFDIYQHHNIYIWFWVSHWMDKLRSQLLLFIWTKIGLVIFSRILFESWWTSCRVFLSWGRKPLGCIPKSRRTGLVWQMLIWKEPGDGRKMIKCLLRQTGIHQSQMVEDPRTIMKWFTGFAGLWNDYYCKINFASSFGPIYAICLMKN